MAWHQKIQYGLASAVLFIDNDQIENIELPSVLLLEIPILDMIGIHQNWKQNKQTKEIVFKVLIIPFALHFYLLHSRIKKNILKVWNHPLKNFIS